MSQIDYLDDVPEENTFRFYGTDEEKTFWARRLPVIVPTHSIFTIHDKKIGMGLAQIGRSEDNRTIITTYSLPSPERPTSHVFPGLTPMNLAYKNWVSERTIPKKRDGVFSITEFSEFITKDVKKVITDLLMIESVEPTLDNIWSYLMLSCGVFVVGESQLELKNPMIYYSNPVPDMRQVIDYLRMNFSLEFIVYLMLVREVTRASAEHEWLLKYFKDAPEEWVKEILVPGFEFDSLK